MGKLNDAKPLEQWIKLIGGPRDGTEFESWACGKTIEFSGYTLEKMDERLGIAVSQIVHVYSRRAMYLGDRNNRRVLWMDYEHAEVKEKAGDGNETGKP